MEKVLELVGLIYTAVAGASHWQTFLDALVSAIGCERAALLIHNTEGEGFSVVCWRGWPDEDIQLYLNRYGAIDPWRIGIAPFPEGAVGCDFDILPREEMEASATFREFYAPRDCIHSMGGVILVTATGKSYLSAHRGSKKGSFGDPEMAILSPLMPHLKQAALLHGEFGAMRRQLTTFTAHLDRYPHALLLTDDQRRVLYANTAARDIVAQKDGLVMEAGNLRLMSGKRDALFREGIGKIAADKDATLVRLEVRRPSGKEPFRLILMPVQDSNVIPLGVSQPAIAILIVDSDSQPELNHSLLRQMFSLTPTEARVAARLVVGRNVEEIAAESGVSAETVRTHIKRVLSKTSTRRQAELISLLLRTVPFRS